MSSKLSKAINVKEHIPFHRMIAYASTDAAGNLIYTTLTTFILY